MGVHRNGKIGHFGRGSGPPGRTTHEAGTGRGREMDGRAAHRVSRLQAARNGQVRDREAVRCQKAFNQLSSVLSGVRKRVGEAPLQPGDGHRMNAASRGHDGWPQPPHGWRYFDDRVHLDHPKG
jgi:hypothetical protein